MFVGNKSTIAEDITTFSAPTNVRNKHDIRRF